MKALIVVTFEERLSDAARARFEADWNEHARLDFTRPLVISGGGQAQVIYLPDNFPAANVYAPEETARLIELLRRPNAVVIGDALPPAATSEAARLVDGGGPYAV